MAQIMAHQMLISTLEVGTITLTIEFSGYAYPEAHGTDAGWLRGRLCLVSDEVVLRRPFLTLAPLSHWLDALQGFLQSHSDEAVLANLEEDFELVLKRAGGDLYGVLRAKLWGGVVSGQIESTFPMTLSAVEQFHKDLEEASWAFPERN